jgi:hypothetical protein
MLLLTSDLQPLTSILMLWLQLGTVVIHIEP